MMKQSSRMKNSKQKVTPEWNFEVGLQMVPNSRIPQMPQESKRFQQMSEDIRNFTLRQSMPMISSSYGAGSPPQQTAAAQSVNSFTNIFSSTKNGAEEKTPFSLISNTFGFEHHPGTDRSAELKVLKLLLRRENLLLMIIANADKLVEVDNMKGIKTVPAPKRSEILDLLTRIRNVTLELIEAICVWRISGTLSKDPADTPPMPFLWKNSSYLLKIVYDLDFMGNTPPLYESLSIPREKLFANPLMLPNTLQEVTELINPEDSARADAGGNVNSEFYRERLRLRKAERVLLQELQLEMEYAQTWNNNNDGSNNANINNMIGNNNNQDMLFEQSEATAESSMFNNSLDESFQPPIPSDSRGSNVANVGSRNSQHALASGGDDGAGKNIIGGGGGESFRDMDVFDDFGDDDDEAYMDFRQQQTNQNEVTFYDIETILNLNSPPRSLMLAGAAILILLTEGSDVPSDISWEAFREVASIDDIAWDMNSMILSNIPRFKVRAINPFIPNLESYLASWSNQQVASNTDMSILKILRWVVKIMEIANRVIAQGPKKGQKVSKTDRLLASISSSDKGDLENTGETGGGMGGRENLSSALKQKSTEDATASKKKRTSRSSTNKEMGPVERRKRGEKGRETSKIDQQNKKKQNKVPKIEKQLCTLHSEMLNDVFQRPLFLTLLGPSYLLSGEDVVIPDRFVVKIYDPLTSSDVEGAINTREYTLLLRDLQNKFGFDLTAFFMPISHQWWAQNLRSLILVKSKPNNKLSLMISKKKIEELIQTKFGTEYEKNGQGVTEYYDDDFDGGYDLEGEYFDEMFDTKPFDEANIDNSMDNRPSSRSSVPPPAVIQATPGQQRPFSQPGQDRPRSQASQERPGSQASSHNSQRISKRAGSDGALSDRGDADGTGGEMELGDRPIMQALERIPSEDYDNEKIELLVDMTAPDAVNAKTSASAAKPRSRGPGSGSGAKPNGAAASDGKQKSRGTDAKKMVNASAGSSSKPNSKSSGRETKSTAPDSKVVSSSKQPASKESLRAGSSSDAKSSAKSTPSAPKTLAPDKARSPAPDSFPLPKSLTPVVADDKLQSSSSSSSAAKNGGDSKVQNCSSKEEMEKKSADSNDVADAKDEEYAEDFDAVAESKGAKEGGGEGKVNDSKQLKESSVASSSQEYADENFDMNSLMGSINGKEILDESSSVHTEASSLVKNILEPYVSPPGSRSSNRDEKATPAATATTKAATTTTKTSSVATASDNIDNDNDNSKDGGGDNYADDFDSVDYNDDFEKAPPNVAAAKFPSDYDEDFNTQDAESQLGSSLGIFEDLDVSDASLDDFEMIVEKSSTVTEDNYVSDSFEGESSEKSKF